MSSFTARRNCNSTIEKLINPRVYEKVVIRNKPLSKSVNQSLPFYVSICRILKLFSRRASHNSVRFAVVPVKFLLKFGESVCVFFLSFQKDDITVTDRLRILPGS